MKRQNLAALAAWTLFVVGGGAVGGLPVGWQLALVAAGFAVAGWRVPAAPVPQVAPLADRPQPALGTGFGRALLERMPAALIVVSEQERLTYANPAARALIPTLRTGAPIATMIRAPAFIEALEKVIATGDELQFGFGILSGADRSYEARAAFLPAGNAAEFGADGQVIVLIEDRTRDRALLQMRSDFVANASHELRTPLASILGYIETLQGHARDDAEAREMFLGIMSQQAQRMKRLVDDLMSLSRIEMNAHVRPEERVDLHRLAAEAANALFPLATQSDVLLQIEFDGSMPGPQVLGDRDQLVQVISNLVDNAIKYGGRSGKVRVKAAEPDPRHPGQAGIAVIDQGPGIAREHIPRLTERFFRVNPGKSKDLGGTGLGLAIVKHILARHGGALDIRSTQGEGSRFVAWVPLAPPKESGDPGKEQMETGA